MSDLSDSRKEGAEEAEMDLIYLSSSNIYSQSMSLATTFGSICNNPLFSDIRFTFNTNTLVTSNTDQEQDGVGDQQQQQNKFEGRVFYGHKNILAARSEYFSTMFTSDPNGQFVTKSDVCNITDVDPDVFELVMKYIYSDTLETFNLTVDMVLAILYAAKQYLLDILVTKCLSLINQNMNQNNIHLFLGCINLLNDKCVTKLNSWIQTKTTEILQHPGFMELELAGISYILQNDSLTAPEIEIFNSLIFWAKKKCKNQNLDVNGENVRRILGPALALIRFPIMTVGEFTRKVVAEKILTIDEEVWVYRTIGNGGVPLNLSSDKRIISPIFNLKKRGPLKCQNCCGTNPDNCVCNTTGIQYCTVSRDRDEWLERLLNRYSSKEH